MTSTFRVDSRFVIVISLAAALASGVVAALSPSNIALGILLVSSLGCAAVSAILLAVRGHGWAGVMVVTVPIQAFFMPWLTSRATLFVAFGVLIATSVLIPVARICYMRQYRVR